MDTTSTPWPEPTIRCVECGETAHLLREQRADEPAEPGDIVAYRCSECGQRWDVVLEAGD
jgi:DNA-directed RNA polymerase subunit M/transcription elongation factor TFIIS